jgi:BirA family biotin operon repressor/biotin-[acetyl-CoA-carboxylase] ligase
MIGRTRWRFREVGSTQDVGWRLAEMGSPHGTVVRADYQSAGRGRQGRSWDVPADTALMFSVVLRPDMPLHLLGPLSIRLATVLCDSFECAGANDVALKWPNDVLIGGRKVSGILVQTRAMPNVVAIAGIGINISTPGEALPPTATSLAAATGHDISIDALFDDILSGIGQMWATWDEELDPHQVRDIDDRLWLNGQPVTLQDAGREISGTVAGVSPDGGLRLLVEGTERVIYAGEITRGPRPIEPAGKP